ncbi:MAG: hypothetical protein DRJ52_09600 [Thermoprotei archaeon]|nr:MAG: hypothetical protein DRJ52_09600 [Thermoprotei archaeon]RLE99358.1 MAG: hypothetical protein DRJ63_05660 [Thermoprotei archaeon]
MEKWLAEGNELLKIVVQRKLSQTKGSIVTLSSKDLKRYYSSRKTSKREVILYSRALKILAKRLRATSLKHKYVFKRDKLEDWLKNELSQAY